MIGDNQHRLKMLLSGPGLGRAGPAHKAETPASEKKVIEFSSEGEQWLQHCNKSS